MGEGIVQKPGAIKIMLPAGIDSVNGYVYNSGDGYFCRAGNRGNYVVLDSVPAGRGIAVDYSVSGGAILPNTLAENISVVRKVR